MLRSRNSRFTTLNLDATIQTLEGLLADLKRARNRDFPTPQELASAPLIDDFVLGHREVPVLEGTVYGHPLLGNTWCRTSELWLVAPELGWVRTISRFYRLGRAAGTDGGSDGVH